MGQKLKLRLRTAGLLGTGNGAGSGVGGAGGRKINKTSFGTHIGNLANTTIWGDYDINATNNYHQVDIPAIGLGTLRLWDSNGVSWRNIERSSGVFTWDRLDNAVDQALANGLDIIYTLGCGPDWATVSPGMFAGLYVGYNPHKPISNLVWNNWCTAVATRYIGKIKYYEIWNEVNDYDTVSVGSGFTGTTSDIVNLTQQARQTILAIDPSAKILSPNFVKEEGIVSGIIGAVTLDGFLAQGGGDHCDIISVHGYNTLPTWTRPEGMMQMGKLCSDTLLRYSVVKPMWNTEWGFGRWRDSSGVFFEHPVAMPDDKASAYITRMVVLSWCSGFERFCFYGLDAVQSYATIVMVNPASDIAANTLLQPALAYKYCSDIFSGGYLSDLQATVSPTSKLYYRANFKTSTNKSGTVVWCDDYDTTDIPTPGVLTATDNLGNPLAVSGTTTVIGSPKFLFYS